MRKSLGRFPPQIRKLHHENICWYSNKQFIEFNFNSKQFYKMLQRESG